MNRTFDRLPSFDERSRNYPARTLTQGKPLRSFTWGTTKILDQGTEGACVGFAWAQELASRPKVHTRVSNDTARNVYHAARLFDEWPGENYEGTSVLAGAKSSKVAGYIDSYRWCFTLQDLALTVGYIGPVVIGSDWTSGMMITTNGFIFPTGGVEGGHGYVCSSVKIKNGEPHSFAGPNSWSESWGVKGWWRMLAPDFWRLMQEDGEMCVPVGRRWIPALR